jgi:PAS domain S-box-containing protein
MADLTILILEDNADDAMLIQRELRRVGFHANVILARNEAEYLAALTPKVDVVLSDDNLPGYDSAQALAALKEREYDIPFILVSGTLSEEVAVDMLKRGAVDYLLKDRMSRLGISIRGALEERHQRHERQRTERALIQSQQRFKRIFDAATDVILLIDGLTDTILDSNQAARELLGYAPAALTGVQWTQLLSGPAPLEPGKTLLDAVHNVPSMMATGDFLRADGHVLRMDLTATLMDEEDGLPRILATLRDITQKQRIEEERGNAERLLADLQRERALNEQRGRFVAFATHELKTPLTAIISSSDIMKTYGDRIDETTRSKYIDDIISYAKRQLTLIDDLLVLGRLDDGLSQIEMHPLNIEQFVAEQVSTYQQMFKSQSIEFTLQAPQVMDGDPRLVDLIISNLLSNAIRYSPDSKPIRAQLWREDGSILLSVTDQGIGIPVSEQGLIFEAFKRASNTRGITGTGLGLSIVKQAVELHGGTIDFVSQPGEGTTFTVRFPLRRGYTDKLPPERPER